MTSSLNPLSISPKAKNWLKNTRQARVLHGFQSALNLINEYDQVFSLVTPDIGNGPFSVVVSDVDFSSFSTAQTNIEINEHILWIGNVQCDTHQTALWSPLPKWNELRAAFKTINNKIVFIETNLNIQAPRDSLGIMAEQKLQNSAFLHKDIAAIAREAIQILTKGLKNQNLSMIQAAANKLVGLGLGLTPAGDDYLMGVIYGLWMAYPKEFADQSARLIYQTAQNNTSSLSSAWLKAAVDGESGETWHNFFAALLVSEKTQIENAVDRILRTGHTSGADAMQGFLQTLNNAFIR
jgi:hypothetical protein